MPLVTANGIPLYYDVQGEGEPLLWIQGLGADHTAWAAQVPAFRRSFRCIIFDNRDAGQSAQVAAPYSIVDLAADAAALLATLGVSPAHVIGLSMGGSIAQELALRHPTQVRSLTLVSSVAQPDARLRTLIAAWGDIYAKAGTVDFYRQAMPWLFSYRFFERPLAVAAFLRYVAAHPQPAGAFARQAAASLTQDALARLNLIRVPTQVILGEEDILVPSRLSRALAGTIPGATLAVVPASGHVVNVEQVAPFNRIVGEFLERQAGG